MTSTGFLETVEARFHDWNYHHPRIIYQLMRALKPEFAIEVGSYRGYCACYMARAFQEMNRGRLYCIDDFSLTDHVAKYGDPQKHWEDNLKACGVRDWVTLLNGRSDSVLWPAKVDFAYIDGWHSFEVVEHDFRACESRGARCICLDDTINCVGPRLLVSRLRDPLFENTTKWQSIDIPCDNGLTIFMRNDPKIDVTFSQELRNIPGTDLSVMTPAQRAAHFKEAYTQTGLDYSKFVQ